MSNWNTYETILNDICTNYPDIWNNADFNLATSSTNVSLLFWLQYPNKLNKYLDNISLYSKMTIDEIIYYKDIINFNWILISMRKDITWDIIQTNPTLPWEYKGISQNPNITMEIVYANMDKPWDFNIVLQTLIRN